MNNSKELRIYCKDSRKMVEVENNSVHLIITSPPYFNLKEYNAERNHQNQIGDIRSYEQYIAFLNEVWTECIRVLVPDGKLCINIMPIFLSGDETKFRRRVTKLVINDLENYMEHTNCMFLQSLYIWDKRKIVRFSSFGSYPYPANIFSTFPFEWIIVFSKEGKRERPSKDAKEESKLTRQEWLNWSVDSLWEMQPAKAQEIGHPAPFPEELPRRLIRMYSFVGDTVLDPFLGSGTTALVALQQKRKAIGYEVNPNYVRLANERLAQLSLPL